MTNSRNFFTVCLLACAFTFFFGSCKKDVTSDLPPINIDNNTPIVYDGPTQRSMDEDMDEMDNLCFDFIYPITVEIPDGSTQTANSDEELEAIFEDYFDSNPTDTIEPMIQFPFDVIIHETGEAGTIQNETQFFMLLDVCFSVEWEECFTINYPVTVIFPDGSSETVNSDEELEASLDVWYDANPTSDEDPTLEFPIEVTSEDGDIISVTNEDELEELFDDCYGDDWDDDDFNLCFDFVFPITINLPNGTSQEANDYAELDEIFFTWFEENPNSEEMPTLTFPLNVELEDGEIVTVNNEEELESLFDECYGDEDDWEECFTFNYPITIVFPDDTTADVNSDDELETTIEAWYDANPMSNEDPTLQFPVDVTTAEGEVLTINTEEELEELFEECFECLVVNGGELAVGSAQSTMSAAVVKQHAKFETGQQKRIAKELSGN